MEHLLVLPPQPQLRHLFPGPPPCAPLGTSQDPSVRSGSVRASYNGGIGVTIFGGGGGGGGVASSAGVLGPASGSFAAEAWAKLLSVQGRQQVQDYRYQAEETMPSSL
jgi:hypothetical protein